MVALIGLLTVLTFWFGERIFNTGIGWDGGTYVNWAKAFPEELFGTGTTTYHAQRVLPAAIVYYTLKLLGVKLTIWNAVTAFSVLNAILLAIAAVLWSHLGHAMKWRSAAVWAGFVALFAGFANARHALYYPTLTDSAAFAIGMAMAWAYLLRKPIVLYVCAALGMVTWPALAPVALVMMLLPRLREPLPEPTGERWRWLIWLTAVTFVALETATFIRWADYFFKFPVNELGIPKFAMWVPRNYLPITVPAIAVVLAAGWWFVVYQPALWNVRALLRTVRWRYIAIVIVGIVALYYARSLWLGAVVKKGAGPTTMQFICLLALEALRGPLWGLVHHAVYFGPIVIVAVLHWRAVCRVFGAWGHAAIAVALMLVVFGVASESRQWVHLLPLLVAATITATHDRWTPRRTIAFGVLALVWSKLWFAIDYDQAGLHLVFPAQRYFMHMGPWANNEMWAIHGACAVVTGVVLFFLLREHRSEPDEQ